MPSQNQHRVQFILDNILYKLTDIQKSIDQMIVMSITCNTK